MDTSRRVKSRSRIGLLRRGAAMALVGLSLVALPSPAAAQVKSDPNANKGPIKPPIAKKADADPILWNIFAMILVIAAVVGANLIPSKRGHQD